MNFILSCTFVSLIFTGCFGQEFSKSASCKNPDFDAKVNSYLSYSAPVISVASAEKDQDKIIFLDAREKVEYDISHIPGAVYVGYKDFDIKKLNHIAKDSKIVVYCSIGYRSEKITAKLRKAGYKYSYNLYGSLFEWVNLDFPVQDKDGQWTNKIHSYNKSWSKWVMNPKIEKVW